MDKTTYGFVGLGLIGGSLAKSIKRIFPQESRILAFDTNQAALSAAKAEGVLDVICEKIDVSFSACDYVFLCAPVSCNDENLKTLSPYLSETCILTDVGSVKTDIHKHILALHLDSHFIGGHPMTGSEKSGYQNSSDRLLENAYYILTPTDTVPAEWVSRYKTLAGKLGALPLVLSCEEHDYVTAAVSHLPHIIAASLVNLVRLSDNSNGTMKSIAAGGFKDITRIASSSPVMWQQICLMNRTPIEALLSSYEDSLREIRHRIHEKDADALYQLFDTAGSYRSSLAASPRGPIKKIFCFYVDIPDETGMIATIATILASHRISIQNIGIINNREFEEGALRIEFHDEASMKQAVTVLQKHNYTIMEP